MSPTSAASTTAPAAERSIIRRASVLTVELERLEVKFASAGEAADLDLYQRTAGNLRRLLEAVGGHMRLPSFKYSGRDPYTWPRTIRSGT